MKITFISTDNEKFGYGYALEKAIKCMRDILNDSAAGVGVFINVYGSLEEYCGRMSEFRWLLATERAENEAEFEEINEHIRFNVIEEMEMAESMGQSIEFHLFPSKVFASTGSYIKFLLKLQARQCSECWLIDTIPGEQDYMIYGLFPREAVLLLTAHPASRQFELQRRVDRGIVENVKMEWSSDRMKFY